MTDARWQRIEAIFTKALDLPEEEWESLLSVECGEDAQLREEVLHLLRQVHRSEDYLKDLAKRVGIPPGDTTPEGLVGRMVGSYRVVRLLGRGGMGAVYLGEREEGGFKLQAAVKLVATGALSESSRLRFLEERRILAALRHPNIARLFDGGFTEDGTPYFVMEYVEGRPIHEHCDRERLSVSKRVELSMQVLKAVQHAHQNLVIHRDLKPGNVLVTEDGQVKLLDFGIARVLDAAEGSFRTETVHPHPMTLAFASPEQVQGRPVSTATDVYGLGLLLYRLIAGRPPYEVPVGSQAMAERAICETDPLPLHRVLDGSPVGGDSPEGVSAASMGPEEMARLRGTSIPRLRREMAGDLGRILHKALRKEPERRYQTVGELSDDLRRYLEGLPVSARPDTASYRLSRFVSRHRVGVIGVGVVSILALALMILGFRYTVTTRAQAARIAQEAATTQNVTDFLLEILSLADPGDGSGDTLTVRAALERGVAHHMDHLNDRPELRAMMLEVMAQAYLGLGMEIEATSLLQEALALRPETGELADTAVAGTLMRLAGAYQARGRFAEALSFHEQALEVLARVGADSVPIAFALGGAANALGRMELLDSARLLGGQALGVLRRHAGANDVRTLSQAVAYAMILRAAEEPDSAEALYRDLLSRLDVSGEGAGKIGAQALNNLGYLLRRKEAYAEAAALYRTSLEEYRLWMAPTERMTTLVNLASVQALQGDTAGAAATLQERLLYARESWPQGSWRVGEAAQALSRFYIRQERFAEAEAPLREAAASFSQTLGQGHAWTANAESILGAALGRLGRPTEAEPLLLRGFEALLAGPGADDPWTADAAGRLAEFLELQGRTDQAARYRAKIPRGP